MKKQKRIWIELDKAESFEDAKENCELANLMLQKLGVYRNPFYAVKKQNYTNTFYNFSDGPASGFTELDDRGQWFNLEYLSKPTHD